MSTFSRLRRLLHLRFKVPSKYVQKSKPLSLSKKILVPIMATTFYNMQEDKTDPFLYKSSKEIEEEIVNKAFLSPEPELLELMEVLEKCIVDSCSQYRICLRKQIEIIEKTTRSGIFSDYLDELPEYRTLAFDLNHELNNYIVLLKTVGEMTYQHLIKSAKGEAIKDINIICEKYKNLEMLLQKQLDENRKFEMELNNANRSMIVPKMSSQKGNASRQRPQKYKNTTAFKNNMHDKSDKTKMINSLQINDVCARCKEVIEWKIKYKKYKPLTQPKTCVLCSQKTVKRAYHVMCLDCGRKTGKCTKCCKVEEVVEATNEEKPFRVDREMRFIIKELPERRRRTFNRYLEKKMEEKMGNDELREDLLKKLEELKVDDKDDDDFEFDDDEGEIGSEGDVSEEDE